MNHDVAQQIKFDFYIILYIILLVILMSRAFMASAASQAGDADSSWAPGLTSGLQGSVNVHRGVLCLCHSDSASVLLYFTN